MEILYNLIGNAIKFTKEGTVEVSTAVEGDRLIVRATDTGIDIPTDQQEPIRIGPQQLFALEFIDQLVELPVV